MTIFEDDTPIRLLEAVRPDIYVKGGDYDADTLPERLAVECYGGKVMTVGYLPGRSTTGIVERIRGRPGAPGSRLNREIAYRKDRLFSRPPLR